jgi:hypothetical protein
LANLVPVLAKVFTVSKEGAVQESISNVLVDVHGVAIVVSLIGKSKGTNIKPVLIKG